MVDGIVQTVSPALLVALKHLVGVAMIGGNYQNSMKIFDGLGEASELEGRERRQAMRMAYGAVQRMREYGTEVSALTRAPHPPCRRLPPSPSAKTTWCASPPSQCR